MKWLLVVISPGILHAFGIDVSTELFGGLVLGGLLAWFSEAQTVDTKALDKAIEIYTGGERQYSPFGSCVSMLFISALVVGVLYWLSGGDVLTSFESAPVIAGCIIGGLVLGALLSPEPDSEAIEKHVNDLKSR